VSTRDDPSVLDPRVAVLRFVPSQLTRARELRTLTKKDLAERVEKTASAIGQFERGTARPDPSTLRALSMALGVPPGFFVREAVAPALSMEDGHFRSLRSVSRYLRRQALRTAELTYEVLHQLEEEGIELPEEQLTPLRCSLDDPEAIEAFAAEVRRAWGLGLGPLPRPIQLLEAMGVRVLPLADPCQAVDAFSLWYQEQPFVFLAMHKTPSRTHFDVAHELGHLLLHEDVAPGNPERESEADRFASAFLLPRETYLRECPSRWNLQLFRGLKSRWHVSIQALLYRARRLGRLSEASYRRACVDINKRGMRRNEGGEWPLERPQVLREALQMVSEDLPFSVLATRLGLYPDDLHRLLTPVLDETPVYPGEHDSPPADTVLELTSWFLERFVPAELSVLHPGRGGPRPDPRDPASLLAAEFFDQVPQADIDRAVAELSTQAALWLPKPRKAPNP